MSRRGNPITLRVHVPEGVDEKDICCRARTVMFMSEFKRRTAHLSQEELNELIMRIVEKL